MMPKLLIQRNHYLVVLFASTLFISATLIFILQPLFGKLMLPLLGGSPAVWNACMAFYQVVLFLGYLYVHLLSSKYSIHRQIQIHSVVIILSLVTLPVALPENIMPPTTENPTLWLMKTLFIAIGLPFFVLSSAATLMQKWFTKINHYTSKDPYYLYVASNSGSIIALLSYPFLIEPNLGLLAQKSYWSIGYGLLCILFIVCAFVLWHKQQTNQGDNILIKSVSTITKLRWLALSFVPSSLLLGLTNFISTDIASVPLLWIIPLTLYLLTFILVFCRWADKIHPLMLVAQPIVLLPFIAYAFIDPAALPFELNLLLHLGAFFLAVMVCHGELAKTRPQVQHLTLFYLIMSFGGMLGGMFNTFVAPFVFDAIYEYPIMIVMTLLLRPSFKPQKLIVQAILPVFILALGLGIYLLNKSHTQALIYSATNGFILLTGVCYSFRSKSFALALLTAVILFFTLSIQNLISNIYYQERSFFGVLSVRKNLLLDENKQPEKYHALFHGTTKHGAQRLANNLQTTPLTYYSIPGPVGQLFTLYADKNKNWEVGVVGLGAGALSCYAKPQQHWTYYEIDPLVVKIAKNTNFFTYLKRCSKKSSFVIGDARLSLAARQKQKFDLLIIDAFSSDSVPTHLLTQEAIALYFTKLKTNGILMLHITNRHLEFKKIIAEHLKRLNLIGLIQEFKPQQELPLITASDWVVIAKNSKTLLPLQHNNLGNWQKLPLYFNVKPWTDDFTNIIEIWK